jgi:c-di-GMP-related signal transduction protein
VTIQTSGQTSAVFVARQAILNTAALTHGYELLYRSGSSGPSHVGQQISGDQATLSVINTSLGIIGLDALATDARAYINFTRNMLVGGAAAALPKERVVVEILEDVPPDDEILAICRKLRHDGYVLALDDFCFEEERRPFLEIVDIVKVDFRATTPAERAGWASLHGRARPRYLAEKVENEAEHREALDLGYSYFQGYYFCKPTILSSRAIPSSKLVRLRLLQILHQPSLSPEALHEALKLDASLIFGLLQYLNSAAVGVRRRVTSLWDALILLGTERTKRWLSIAILADLGSDHPPELLRLSAVRARFCELLGAAIDLDERLDDLFLLGLFSLMDVFLGRPLESLLHELPLADGTRRALAGEPGSLRSVYDLAVAYERADWAAVARHAASLRISDLHVVKAYGSAIAFSAQITAA